MQLSGTKTIGVPVDEAFQLLIDPDVLTKCIPGVKQLTARSEHTYEADLEIGVAGIKGRYKGNVEMADVDAPNSYRLLIKGEGPMGFLEGDVKIALTADGADTTIAYDGEATVGGTVAGVGQRVLSGVAKLLIGQFFNAVAKEAAARQRRR